MEPIRLCTGQFCGSVQGDLAFLLPILCRAVSEIAGLTIPQWEPEREDLIAALCTVVLEEQLGTLIETGFCVVSYGNASSDQVFAWCPARGHYVVNWKRLDLCARGWYERLREAPLDDRNLAGAMHTAPYMSRGAIATQIIADLDAPESTAATFVPYGQKLA